MTHPFPFIVGSPRSGTTLLRVMLDAHPDMAVPRESYFVVGLYRRLSRADSSFDHEAFSESVLAHRRLRSWGIPEEELREALERANPQSYSDAIRLIYLTYARHHGKHRYGDKTPQYVLDIPLLSRLFPEARFVHLIRDGRDVALSLMDARPDLRGAREAAKIWRRRVAAGREGGAPLGPGRYREVSYEELIDSPAATVASLCAFIDLEFDERMMRYHAQIDEASFPGQTHLGRPPTKGLRDWRTQMSSDDLAAFEAVAGKLLSEVGYERGLRRIPSKVAVRSRSGDLVEAFRKSIGSTLGRSAKRSASERG